MFTFHKKKPRTILGIDISATSINMLELSQTETQYCVNGYGCAPLADLNDISTTIKSLVLSSHLSSRQAVIAVPDSSAISKIIQINALANAQDMDEWVFMEAEKYIPYPLDDINLDFNILGPSSDNDAFLDVLVVASRTDYVNLRVDAVRRAGIAVQVVDVESYAIERAVGLISSCRYEKNTALFSVSALYMHGFVFHGKNLIFSREEALVNTQVEALLLLIKRILQFYFSSTGEGSVDQILLAGTSALLPCLAAYVYDKLGIATQIANPFDCMAFGTTVIQERIEQDAPQLMVACGLALSGIRVNR